MAGFNLAASGSHAMEGKRGTVAAAPTCVSTDDVVLPSNALHCNVHLALEVWRGHVSSLQGELMRATAVATLSDLEIGRPRIFYVNGALFPTVREARLAPFCLPSNSLAPSGFISRGQRHW